MSVLAGRLVINPTQVNKNLFGTLGILGLGILGLGILGLGILGLGTLGLGILSRHSYRGR